MLGVISTVVAAIILSTNRINFIRRLAFKVVDAFNIKISASRWNIDLSQTSNNAW